MSCRVASRGVGTILLNFIMRKSREHVNFLLADYVNTGCNKLMYATFKFSGFEVFERQNGERTLLKCDLRKIQDFPDYVEVFDETTDEQI